MKATRLVVALAFVVGTPVIALAQTPARARVSAYVDSVVNAAMTSGKVPGVSVAVVKGSDTLVMKGYGFADLENRVPVSAASVFRIGSLTKQFTSAAVSKLVESGRIRLDAPLGDYLTDYPGPGRRVTIHQLLNHTSGIPSYTSLGAKFWAINSRLDLTHQQMLDMFARDSLQFAPGARFLYNNSGYYLLGMLLEKVSGESYAEHLRKTQWGPNALTTVAYCDDSTVIANRVRGYEKSGEAVLNAAPLSMKLPYAAGSLCSNARDLVRWNSLLVNGRIVSPESYARMTTATKLDDGTTQPYGYGLAPGTLGTHPSVAHSGGINGFASFMSWFPADTLTIVVLTNSGSGSPGAIADAIARLILDVPRTAPAPVKDLPLTAADIARYVGTYDLAPAVPLKVRVFADGLNLMTEATGQSAFRVRYQGEHTFVAPDEGIRLGFTVVDGKATRFMLYQGGAAITANRVVQ